MAMYRESSYDAFGPLISLGDVAFSAETNLPGGKQIFEVPTFFLVSEESEVVVDYQGFRLSRLGGSNDFYGFGSSPKGALDEASRAIKKLSGCNVDIRVRATLNFKPCFPDDDKDPFYNGAQRIFYVSPRWTTTDDRVRETSEDFTVWENGKPGKDAMAFYRKIRDLVDRDAAPSRNGHLKSIFTRSKRPDPEFLQEILDEVAP